MLYDNALLTWVYLEAFQLTGDRFYGGIASQTLDYVLREMARVGGGYYSTQDADSEGEEGKYFVWRPEEIEQTLGDGTGQLLCRYLGVTEDGNFEAGSSVLHVDAELRELAQSSGMDEEELERLVEAGKGRLFEVRQERIAPARDDKIIVAWNGLMMSAMAQGYNILREPSYLDSARGTASFILSELVVEGELMHTWKDGRARFRAFQDDYACLVNGLLDLYEASFEVMWLSRRRYVPAFLGPGPGRVLLHRSGGRRPHRADEKSLRQRHSIGKFHRCPGAVAARGAARRPFLPGSGRLDAADVE